MTKLIYEKLFNKKSFFKYKVETDLNVRIIARSEQIKRYEKIIVQFQQNKLFQRNEETFYMRLNGKEIGRGA